jgi:hypothetical protein
MQIRANLICQSVQTLAERLLYKLKGGQPEWLDAHENWHMSWLARKKEK